MLRSEKGVTLLEVLLSMAILSIIFISLMGFFPQMGFMNKQNEDKAQAINSAKDLLITWQHSSVVKNYLQTPSGTIPPGFEKKDSTYYYFKTAKDNFDARIKIKINTELNSAPIKTHLIHIQLLNKRQNVVSETYGYIIIE